MDLSLIVDGIPHKDRDKNSNGQNHHPSPVDSVKTLITSPSSLLTNLPSLAKKFDNPIISGASSNELSSQSNSIASPPTSPSQADDFRPKIDSVEGTGTKSNKIDFTRSSLSPIRTQSNTLPSPRLSVSSSTSASSSALDCLRLAPNLVYSGEESDSKPPKSTATTGVFTESYTSETAALLALTQTQSLRSQSEYQYPCYQQIPQIHPDPSHLLSGNAPPVANGAIPASMTPSNLTVSGPVMPPSVSSITVPTDLSQIPYVFHGGVSVVPRISPTLLPTHGHPHPHFGILPPYPYTSKSYEIHHPPHFPSDSISAMGNSSTPENPTFKREICNTKNSQRLTKTTSQPAVSPPAVLPMRTERVPVRNSIDKDRPKANLKTRQFVCNECGRSFCRKSDLVRHVQIHLGIKPNVCKVCGKQFLQRSALTVHIRVHTGEKPYSCHYCSRPFSDSSSLARHRRIHIRNQEQPRVFVPAPNNRSRIANSQILPESTRTTSN